MFASDDFDPAAHVAALSGAVGLPLTPEEQRAVAAELAQVLSFARPALDRALPADAQPAPVFLP